MSTTFLVLVMACPAAAAGEPQSGPKATTEVNVAAFVRPASPTSGIQEAINALPPSGGVVTIPKGEYALRQPIVLRSGVTLHGAGPGTILHKPRYAETKLAATADKGSRSVMVASAKGFAAGDQVAIRDYFTPGEAAGLHST